MREKLNYVTLERIKREHAHYNWMIGERSNGKTFACLEEIIKNYAKNGEQGALIRRWKEDFRGKRGQVMFAGLVSKGVIKKATSGEYTDVAYYSGQWYFARVDEKLDKLIKAPEPFWPVPPPCQGRHGKDCCYARLPHSPHRRNPSRTALRGPVPGSRQVSLR